MCHADDEEPVSGVRARLTVFQDVLRHEPVTVHDIRPPILAFLNLLPRPLLIDQTNPKLPIRRHVLVDLPNRDKKVQDRLAGPSLIEQIAQHSNDQLPPARVGGQKSLDVALVVRRKFHVDRSHRLGEGRVAHQFTIEGPIRGSPMELPHDYQGILGPCLHQEGMGLAPALPEKLHIRLQMGFRIGHGRSVPARRHRLARLHHQGGVDALAFRGKGIAGLFHGWRRFVVIHIQPPPAPKKEGALVIANRTVFLHSRDNERETVSVNEDLLKLGLQAVAREVRRYRLSLHVLGLRGRNLRPFRVAGAGSQEIPHDGGIGGLRRGQVTPRREIRDSLIHGVRANRGCF
jgi:hypothetical protein